MSAEPSMIMAEIDALNRTRDTDGLLSELFDDDEHIREKAAESLCVSADERIAEALLRIKFEDSSSTVKRAASVSHAMVLEHLEENMITQ